MTCLGECVPAHQLQMCDLLWLHLWNVAHPSCLVPRGCVFKLCPCPSSCICRSLDFARVPSTLLFCLPWAPGRWEQLWNIGTLNLNQHLPPALKCIRVQCFLKCIRKTQFPPPVSASVSSTVTVTSMPASLFPFLSLVLCLPLFSLVAVAACIKSLLLEVKHCPPVQGQGFLTVTFQPW